MEFNKSKFRRHLKPELDVSSVPYTTALQLYTIPPIETISLKDFEDFAVERLKVLNLVETAGVKHTRGSEKYDEYLTNELTQFRKQGILRCILPKISIKNEVDEINERRKDHISHFILRLAYCKSEDLRRWFLSQELDLFRFRFSKENNATIQKFLEHNKLKYTTISEVEKTSIFKELISSTRYQTGYQTDNEDFYKVPFIEALELVKSRKVYLRNGFAYVPQSELIVIILTHYRTILSHALAVTSRAVPHLEEDNRLLPMLTLLSNGSVGSEYTVNKSSNDQVAADQINSLSQKHFPLCMQELHKALRANHHLKHYGRLQYGLFLKAIGLSLEQAMKFWRTEFIKMMDVDKFDKQYAYGVRYNYGKEGKRTDFTPYSCLKIITSNAPAVGDHHGCPFRHTDVDMLRLKFQNMKLSRDGVEEILTLVKNGHYQLACGKYFELTHNSPDYSPNHPNQYYDESIKLLDKGETIQTPMNTPVKVIKVSQSSYKSRISSQSTENFDDEMDSLMQTLD